MFQTHLYTDQQVHVFLNIEIDRCRFLNWRDIFFCFFGIDIAVVILTQGLAHEGFGS